ncbi:hypothetical protein BFC17_13000 [Alteromonas lipolytica]|uniref:6-phosphogluconate dehydrogenase n=2 Tax=Alteromonas lipolytica TaxID=1856405 RepID=A0A1E8FIA7_9ALTE|nr:hypothetical protein BFC17_13000 [Alteromonas lipolytica]
MGKALATRLVQNHELLVWDLNPEAREQLVAAGAESARSLVDLGQRCDVIFLCLPKSTHVEAALFGKDGLYMHVNPGSVIIDQTSGVPAMTLAFSEKLAIRNIAMLDAPVAGGVPAAEAGTITIMASGDSASFNRAKPVLCDISPKVFHCGERVGSAQMVKSINNLLNTANRMMTLELAAMGRVMGLSMAEIVESGNREASQSFLTARLLPGIAEGKPSTDFAIELMVKDTNMASDFAHAHGTAMPVCEMGRGFLNIGLRSIGPDARLEDLIPFVQNMFGVEYCGADTHGSQDNAAVLSEAFAACHQVIAFEGLLLAKKAGLDLNEFCNVINAGSGASAAGNALFAAVLGPDEPHGLFSIRQLHHSIQPLTTLARQHQLPALMLNQVCAALTAAVDKVGENGCFTQLL